MKKRFFWARFKVAAKPNREVFEFRVEAEVSLPPAEISTAGLKLYIQQRLAAIDEPAWLRELRTELICVEGLWATGLSRTRAHVISNAHGVKIFSPDRPLKSAP